MKKPPPSAGFHPKLRAPCLLGAVFIPDGWRWMERRLRRCLRKRVGSHAPRRHAPSSGAVEHPLALHPRSASSRQRLSRSALRSAPYRAFVPHPSRARPAHARHPAPAPPPCARPPRIAFRSLPRARPTHAPPSRARSAAPRTSRRLPRLVAQRRALPARVAAERAPSSPESAQINSNFPYLVKFFLDGLRFTSYLNQLHFFADSRILLKEERPRGPRKNR